MNWPELRYEASTRPGFQESFAAMFPAPRQRWVDAMASREATSAHCRTRRWSCMGAKTT